MSILREIAAKFGLEFDDNDLKKMNAGVASGVKLLGELGGALTGAAIVVGIRGFVQDITEAGSALNDASDRLGVTSRDLQELQLAFGSAGVRGEQLNNALAGLSSRAEQARAGTGPAADAFQRLGVRAADAHGQVRPVSDLMDDLAGAMGRVEDPAERVRLSIQLFGGVGRRLVGVLHDGEGGLRQLRGQLDELGGGMSEDAVHAADDFGDAMQRQQVAMLSFKSQIGNALLPILTRLTDGASHLIAMFTRWTRGTHVVQLGMLALSAVAAVQLWPTIARLAQGFFLLARAQAVAFLGIATAILLVDDLITLFHGGNSVIGVFLDRMLGVGTSQRFVRALREAWEGFQLAIHDTGQALAHLWDGVQQTGSRIINGFKQGWSDFLDMVDPSRVTRRAEAARRGQAQGRQAAAQLQAGANQADVVAGLIRGAGIAPAAAAPTGRAGLSTHSGLIETWQSILGIGDFATDATTTRVAHKAAKVEHHYHGNTTIHVNGTGSPDQVADRVVRRLDQQQRNAADAAHPLPQRGDE